MFDYGITSPELEQVQPNQLKKTKDNHLFLATKDMKERKSLINYASQLKRDHNKV